MPATVNENYKKQERGACADRPQPPLPACCACALQPRGHNLKSTPSSAELRMCLVAVSAVTLHSVDVQSAGRAGSGRASRTCVMSWWSEVRVRARARRPQHAARLPDATAPLSSVSDASMHAHK
ncbi:unnamed protein product [Chrysodeixis includens]|uniref:Uncharacterized protein n=1 Tax=Chrysodeixis includens TaxID=689277 RepID=A0A9N8KSG7_CHRIL|nr:unnamed protein product [Chrysodeixis includens]